jgi:hypothetical protein
VDWHVLPRAEDDVALADTKTKVLKYVADLNRVQFVRSRAFADAIKVGVGWLDDGVRDDPTEDVLYSRYEDWRNVLWDSAAYVRARPLGRPLRLPLAVGGRGRGAGDVSAAASAQVPRQPALEFVDVLAFAPGQVFELVAADAADGEVARLRVGEVKAGD